MGNVGGQGKMRRWLVCAFIGIGSGSAAADPKLLAYGRHLAQECTTCHNRDGADKGIPSIIGMPVKSFVETMGYYKTGRRTNPVMVSVAQSLDDDQIEAIAAYFATASGD
jgi:cytochrome c553